MHKQRNPAGGGFRSCYMQIVFFLLLLEDQPTQVLFELANEFCDSKTSVLIDALLPTDPRKNTLPGKAR